MTGMSWGEKERAREGRGNAKTLPRKGCRSCLLFVLSLTGKKGLTHSKQLSNEDGTNLLMGEVAKSS